MRIQKYEDWMRPQVIALFDMEYSTGEERFESLFQAFYEHPYQSSQCIRIVAVDGERVAGFQSFFYWPVSVNGRTVRSFQSGNSLVHPDYRGKGLFGKMLNFIHEPDSGFGCELLIGFPVEASFNSFMRNGWKNPFDLQWYIKPLNPVLSLFASPEKQLRKHLGDRSKLDFNASAKISFVAQSALFDDYRFNYESGDFYRFNYDLNGSHAMFEMKAQRRKKVIRELVIGKFLCDNTDPVFIQQAFRQLEHVVRKSSSFSMISIAVNPLTHQLCEVLEKRGFRKIDRKIYFIAKGPVADSITDWSDWWIYRADIDTW